MKAIESLSITRLTAKSYPYRRFEPTQSSAQKSGWSNKFKLFAIGKVAILAGLMIGGAENLAQAQSGGSSLVPANYDNVFNTSKDFTVSVTQSGGAEAVPVYNAWTPNTSPDIPDVDSNGKALGTFCWGGIRLSSFQFVGTVQVSVTYNPDKGPIKSFQINPLSLGIQGKLQGNTITFSLTKPEKLEIQINGAMEHESYDVAGKKDKVSDADKLLYLFAESPETNAPSASDSKVIYCAAGVNYLTNTGTIAHVSGDARNTLCRINPKTNQTLVINDSTPQDALYLESGALLNANILLDHRSRPFHIYGYGLIQNPVTAVEKASYESKKVSEPNVIFLKSERSNGVVIENVTFINSIYQTFCFNNGSYNRLENVKSLHTAVNSDGIGLSGGANSNEFLNMFILGNDNQIVIGANDASEPVGPHNNLIAGCTFIKGHAGNWAFPQADGPIGSGNVIEDCDVVRTCGGAALIAVDWNDPSSVANLLFKDIRVQSLEIPHSGGKTASYFGFETLAANNRVLTLQNVSLPALSAGTPPIIELYSTSEEAETKGNAWQLVFQNVTVAGQNASDKTLGIVPNELSYLHITTQFDQASTTVTALAEPNGSILAGSSSGVSGEFAFDNTATAPTFTVTPNKNYAIAEVVVDGVPQADCPVRSSTYQVKLTSPITDHTIHALFVSTVAGSLNSGTYELFNRASNRVLDYGAAHEGYTPNVHTSRPAFTAGQQWQLTYDTANNKERPFTLFQASTGLYLDGDQAASTVDAVAGVSPFPAWYVAPDAVASSFNYYDLQRNDTAGDRSYVGVQQMANGGYHASVSLNAGTLTNNHPGVGQQWDFIPVIPACACR